MKPALPAPNCQDLEQYALLHPGLSQYCSTARKLKADALTLNCKFQFLGLTRLILAHCFPHYCVDPQGPMAL